MIDNNINKQLKYPLQSIFLTLHISLNIFTYSLLLILFIYVTKHSTFSPVQLAHLQWLVEFLYELCSFGELIVTDVEFRESTVSFEAHDKW